jgi:hypothetical protein
MSVTPTAAGTLSYVLTCTGAGGSGNASASLTITAALPTVTITVAPTSITVGQSAALTWSSTNATSCTASNAWTGSEAVSGTMNETPTAAGTLTYVLTCSINLGLLCFVVGPNMAHAIGKLSIPTIAAHDGFGLLGIRHVLWVLDLRACRQGRRHRKSPGL